MVGQPAKVGRGLRSIAINIANLARENEYFEAANGKVKIALQDSNGEMLSTYNIMAKLAEKWGTLNETEQTAIATSLAGKTQFEVFANVMKNWATAANVVDNAVKANGSSLRENEKYLDSIEGKLQSFQSAWEQLSYHVINSDFLKNVIDLGTELITVLDELVQSIGTLPTLIGVVGTAFGGWKALKLVPELLGISTAMQGVAEGAEAIAGGAAAASGTKGLGGLAKILPTLTANLPYIAIAIAGIVGAIALAKDSYDQTFTGKLEKYHEIGDEIQNIQGEIDELLSKEGGLTDEELARLNILKSQLEILKKQKALTLKEATDAFNKEAEKKFGGTGLQKDSQYMVGDKYLNSLKAVKDIEDQIAAIEKKRVEGRLTTEDEKNLKRLESAYKDVSKAQNDWLIKLQEEHDKLADVDYTQLSKEGKAWYDNTHSAYLQATNDIESVQNAIGNTIDMFGSAQFDSWDIDTTSLKNASDLASQISEKIKSLEGDQEITIYARDEAGNIINEITKQKSDLTDKEWEVVVDATTTGNYDKLDEIIQDASPEHKEVLLEFKEVGASNVKATKEKLAETKISTVKVQETGSERVKKTIEDAAKNRDSLVTYEEKGAAQVKKAGDDAAKARTATISFVAKGLSYIQSAWNNLKASLGFAGGKRKGEEGGMAWLGDEGSRSNPKPELVVSADGKAYLAGTTGWEMYPIKDSDTVYTYSQTKKLLGGKQTIKGFAGNLPRYKKGKKKKTTAATNANVQKASNKVKKAKSKAAKKKAKKNLQKLEKQRQKKRDAFDKEVEKLKHKAKVNHWTDAKYQAEYKKLYNKYQAYLSDDQSDDYTESREDYENERDTSAFKEQAENILNQQDLANFISAVNANDNLSDDEKKELVQDAGNKFYTSEFNRRIGTIGHGENVGNLVNSIQNNEYLNAKEKQDLIAETYKTSVEYNLKEYKNGKATREQILADIENYYKTRGQYDETYYKMLDELREADKEKELKRLEDLQKVQDNSLSLAQKYIRRELNLVQKQIDATKEEADQLERLTELEKELTNAKSKKIRVYREGIGFVYERDVEAIEKAEKALDDYKSSLNKTPLEERAEELQAILDLFDEIGDNSAIRDLEVLLGVGNLSELTGGIDTNSSLSSWATWISALFAKKSGLIDLISKLNDVSTSDLDAWLTASGGTQISDALLAQYIGNHSFASGTISAPGGLSRVAERLGGELVWLGKGDSVYSNAVSRNLMEWGRYNPAQVMNSNNSASTQVFNFDQIVLPNVYNANDFYRELQNLPNKALQQSARRA